MDNLNAQFREYVRLDRKRTDDGLTVPEMERWRGLKRVLTRAFSPLVSDDQIDQRNSVRIPTRLQVSFESEGELGQSLMTNLSRYGVFIQTRRPFEIGTRFELRIHIAEPAREIATPVQVVSVGVGPSLRPECQGMGCRFTELTPDLEKQIADLYERALK